MVIFTFGKNNKTKSVRRPSLTGQGWINKRRKKDGRERKEGIRRRERRRKERRKKRKREEERRNRQGSTIRVIRPPFIFLPESSRSWFFLSFLFLSFLSFTILSHFPSLVPSMHHSYFPDSQVFSLILFERDWKKTLSQTSSRPRMTSSLPCYILKYP